VFAARYGLNIYNSTFCPHSVFMCFVWISEQTAVISLYSIHWLVFVTETECVYCAVRTESLYVIQVNFSCLKFSRHEFPSRPDLFEWGTDCKVSRLVLVYWRHTGAVPNSIDL